MAEMAGVAGVVNTSKQKVQIRVQISLHLQPSKSLHTKCTKMYKMLYRCHIFYYAQGVFFQKSQK